MILTAISIYTYLLISDIVRFGRKVSSPGDYPLPTAAISASFSPTPRPRTAVYSLELDRTTVTTGGTFEARVLLEAAQTLVAADAIVTFNPELLTVVRITQGEMFSQYPRLLPENASGRAIITGLNTELPDNPETPDIINLSPQLFATVTFRAKKTGTAEIGFDFEYGSTNKSTAVPLADDKNILSHTEPARITISN